MVTVEKYISKARSYVGTVAGTPKHKEILKAYNSIRPLPRGYTVKVSDAWCATFVSAIASLVGFGNDFPYECGVQKMSDIAKSKKQWVDVGVTPKRGWLVIYDWQKDGHADHVGIVETVKTKNITVIEGNYNSAVRIRTIAKDSPLIKGFIALKYKSVNMTSNEVIAREVIQGKWGNGEDRKKRLKKAGYDPTAIQKIVNKLMK